MNALSVAWKLRSDLSQILAASSPRRQEGDSAARLKRAGRSRQTHAKSDIRELLSGNGPADVGSECEPLQVSGVEGDRG